MKQCFSILFFTLFFWGGEAQHSTRSWASNVIVPQSRVLSSVRSQQQVQITEVRVGVVILQQVATTLMEISVKNPTSQRLEAEMVIPVPNGATIRGFTFQGTATEPTAKLLPQEEARKIYNEIVSKMRDPAILEFIGYNLVRSSVFPVEPNGTQKIRLTYEQLLPADGNRIDYVLPRTESVEYQVPWKISVRIQHSKPISTVYSPSHALETQRLSQTALDVQIAKPAVNTPGSFLLSYLLASEEVTASLFTYPDPAINGGYFMLLAGLPTAPSNGNSLIKREVTLVFDRSGSMNGEKMDQVRESALQVIEGLEPNEAFNIIIYNEYADLFSKAPVLKTKENIQAARQFLNSVQPRGGTNIHDALVEAFRQKPIEGYLPIVLFLTDGLPTIGKTSEEEIAQIAVKANPHKRRVFTFGVGVDVNTPLLERVASDTRATATFVFPKENVEVKVGQVFKRLSGPILADPVIEYLNPQGTQALGRVLDVFPSKLPDIFEGDQLILLGQYVGEEPLTFRVTGNYLGQPKTFQFSFHLDKATTRNAFVPRLWASRKIAILIEEIRRQGAQVDILKPAPKQNLKLQELIDEIIRLSTQFGILTEYTAFFAQEGTDLSNKEDILRTVGKNFQERAYSCRSGWGSVNQELNSQFGKNQSVVNPTNDYYDQTMKRVSVSRVQQVNDRTFYQREGCWVDSRLVEKIEIKPDRVISIDSQEFYDLAQKLANQGRQGCFALKGDIYILVDGELLLIKVQ